MARIRLQATLIISNMVAMYPSTQFDASPLIIDDAARIIMLEIIHPKLIIDTAVTHYFLSSVYLASYSYNSGIFPTPQDFVNN